MKFYHLFALCVFLCFANAFGHEQAVHQAITKHAVELMSGDSSYVAFLGVVVSDTEGSPIKAEGSVLEL